MTSQDPNTPPQLPAPVTPGVAPSDEAMAALASDASASSMRLPSLKIVHDKGAWNFAGTEILMPSLTLVAFHEFRVLHMKAYNDLGEGEENEIACVSADGMNGYGYGGRSAGAEVKKRVCAKIVSGRLVKECPSAAGDGADWICRPKVKAMVMLTHKEASGWLPAAISVSGQSVAVFKAAFSTARMRAAQCGVVNGRPKVPLWCVCFQPMLTKPNPKRIGYVPEFGKPTVCEQPDMDAINGFLNSYGAGLWMAEKQSMDRLADGIGKPKQQKSGPASIHDEEIPF